MGDYHKAFVSFEPKLTLKYKRFVSEIKMKANSK